MIDIGRICVKIAGRDAGKKCVVVDILDENYVLVDGETRRRKCNILHLEPLDKTIDIKKGAGHEEVAKAAKDLGWQIFAPKTKPKTVRPRKARRSKLATTPAAAAPTVSAEKPAAEKKPHAPRPEKPAPTA